MITRVRVQNFKSLKDVSVELTPFTVLIGPNNSGKSNFLSALRFLSATVRGLLDDAVEEMKSPYANLFFNQDQAQPLRLMVEVDAGWTQSSSLLTEAANHLRLVKGKSPVSSLNLPSPWSLEYR